MTVRFWKFGPSPVQDNFAVASSLYILGRLDGTTFTPLADHPPLIDTICGDVRYSAIRRVQSVPVSATYKGELITSVEALDEAIERGLVGDPVPDGTWVNVPVVVPGRSEAATPLRRGDADLRTRYRVEASSSARIRAPAAVGLDPIGQRRFSRRRDGTPPTLTTTVDPQPVSSSGQTTHRRRQLLATRRRGRCDRNDGPTTSITSDGLFRRSANARYGMCRKVASTVGTTVKNLQQQFVEGAP